MVEENSVLNKFQKKVDNSSTGNYSDLEIKLRQKVEESKKKQEQTESDTIITQKDIDGFARLIKESSSIPKEIICKIKDTSQESHDVVMKFYNNQCEIVSDLFPEKFSVVPDNVVIDKSVLETTWGITEFLEITNILRKFGGRVVKRSEGAVK